MREGYDTNLLGITRFSAEDITKAEFDTELQKGVDSIKKRLHSFR